MNFRCPRHPHKTKYASKSSFNGTRNFDENKNPIICPQKNCSRDMVLVEEKGEYSVHIGTYSSMSPEDKKKHLKARSKKDSLKNREYRRHLDLSHITKK